MLVAGGKFSIFLYPRPMDMRAGYDRLAFLCDAELGIDPYQASSNGRPLLSRSLRFA
jgi:hypothetical protein